MMKITGLSHLFKWENLHNWWLTKYFFAPLYITFFMYRPTINMVLRNIINMTCYRLLVSLKTSDYNGKYT